MQIFSTHTHAASRLNTDRRQETGERKREKKERKDRDREREREDMARK